MANETINFNKFQLTIDNQDAGGRYYKEPKFWADLSAPLQLEIITRFHPVIFLDIGANYGFTSLIHHSYNKNARVIAVEDSPQLIPFLETNFKQNDLINHRIINAIVSEKDEEIVSFHLNPNGSQDNRVLGEAGWKDIPVKTLSINTIASEVKQEDFILIKIDVQGYEERVFKGGESFLAEHSNWLIKSEFAPYWLRSQGTDPVSFIEFLISKYVVAEIPNRCRFRGDYLSSIVRSSLKSDDSLAFVNYIESLAKRSDGVGIGWCDLVILPLSLAEKI